MLYVVALVLDIAFLAVLLLNRSSRSVKVYSAKVVILVALLIVQILIGNLWLSIFWGFVLFLNAVLLVVYAIEIEASYTTEIQFESTDEKDGDYHCSHCRTATDTKRGYCEQCGAPLVA